MSTELTEIVTQFMTSRKAMSCTAKTLEYYRDELRWLIDYLTSQGVHNVTDITRDHIRAFLAAMAERRRPGGVHIAFRVAKTFTRWVAAEYQLTDWQPMRNVKPPRLGHMPLPPISLDHIRALLATCDESFTGTRDKAMMLMLLDTGLRAFELLALTLDDLDGKTVHVRRGKGGKRRVTFIGDETQQALNAYLEYRGVEPGVLWHTEKGEPLSMNGLKSVMRRRASLAGIPMPAIHGFRRAFALAMLRSGADLRTIQVLLGHSQLVVTERYLRLELSDLAAAHKRHGPVAGLFRTERG